MKPKFSMEVVIKHPKPHPPTRNFTSDSIAPRAPAHLVAIVEPGFPHISDRVTLPWGTWQLQQYLTKLLVLQDPRPNRRGFPTPILSALLKLYVQHSAIAPTQNPKFKNTDVWENVLTVER